MEEICEYCVWHNCDNFCDNDESRHYAQITSDDDTCEYHETLESL